MSPSPPLGPSAHGDSPGGTRPPIGMGQVGRDGWEENAGLGGRGSQGWGLQWGQGRSRIAQCGHNAHCTDTIEARWSQGGSQAGGGEEGGLCPPPQLHRLPHSSPGQPPAVPKGRMRHFSCCHTQRRGADGKALRTGCCSGSVGVLASRSPRAASVHASVRAGWRCRWHVPGTTRRWRLVVMAQVAVLCPVPWAAHGAEHSGDPGSPGTRGLLGSHVPSLALLRSPGGCPGRGTAWGHRGGAHMLSASW